MVESEACPQQLLDLAQIGAGREQVGCKGMAQRVRRSVVRQAELFAQAGDGELDDARRQRTAANAQEQAIIGLDGIRALCQIGFDLRR